MKDKDKPIPMTKEEEYRNADVPMPEEEVYGQAQQVKLRESYKQSLANREERTKKKYPERPITGKEWIDGYNAWKKRLEDYGSKR